MGSKTSSQQNQTQTTSPDPYARSALDQTIGRALSVAQTPYQQYTGELTAGVNSAEFNANQRYDALTPKTQGYLDTATSQANQSAQGYNPAALGAADISKYESPYQNDVINATLRQINQQNAIQQQGLAGNAIQQGAFGGDRAGVASAALAGQQNLSRDSTLAGLNNQNYAQALATAQQQQGLQYNAAQANRAALANASSELQNIAALSNSTGLANANAQLGFGALQQQTRQAADTAKYQQFQQAAAFPYAQTAFQSSIVNGSAPLLGGTTTGTTQQQTSPVNSIVGGLTGILGLLSDERAKDDIRPIGKTFDGQKLYSFRYKGDDRTHVGLMAQEVEKKHPEAIGSLGDLKTVDYDLATRKAANRGHFAAGGAALYGSSIGEMPYAAGGQSGYIGNQADSYVPGLTARAGQLNLPKLPAPQSSSGGGQNQGLGGLTKAIGGTGFGDAISDFSQDNLGGGLGGLGGLAGLATGGKVVSLDAARARRGYDGGGVVGTEGLLFDPNAMGADTPFAPGLGIGATADSFVPPPPARDPRPVDASSVPLPPMQGDTDVKTAAAPPSGSGSAINGGLSLPPPRSAGLGAAVPVNADPPAPGGLGAAAMSPSTPVPVAPASNARAYTGGDGNGLGAAGVGNAPPVSTGGLGAINAVAPPSDQAMGRGFGFDRSVGRTLGFEGGFNPSDSNGTPSNFGINGAAHPGLDIANLTQDQAKGIYKRDYWDAIGADKLPPALAHVAFDTAVIAGPERAKQMIAESGGDPGKFMDLRDQFTNGLIAANPQKYGQYQKAWADRSAGLRSDIGAGGAQSDALGYAGAPATGNGGLGAASTSSPSGGVVGTPDAPAAPHSFSDNFSPMLGGTGQVRPGHSGGLLGLFPGASDAQLQQLQGLGFGMAASTSMSPGVALGEGGLKGLKAAQAAQGLDRESALARASIANTNSEIGYRKDEIGVRRQEAEITAKKFETELAALSRQLKASSEAASISTQPGSFAQPSAAAPPAGVPSDAGTAPPTASAPDGPGAPAGGPSTAAAPVSADAGNPGGSTPQATAFASGDAEFWSRANPDYNPQNLMARADAIDQQAAVYRKYGQTAQADQLSQQSNMLRTRVEGLSGKPVMMKDGTFQYAPSYLSATNQQKEMETEAGERGKRGTQMFDWNKPIYDQTAKSKDDAVAVKANAQALRNLVFNSDGSTAVDTGPQGEWRAETAAHLKQLGFSDSIVNRLTDPSKAEAVQKLSTDMVAEVARQSIGAGNRLDQTEYRNTIKGVPNNEILPKTIQFLTDKVLIPKSNWAINRYGAIADKDLHETNLQSELFKYDRANPLDQVINPQPDRPAAPINGQAMNVPSRDRLRDGVVYSTARGAAKWDATGNRFVPVQ